jgi:DnaK suppressor protein
MNDEDLRRYETKLLAMRDRSRIELNRMIQVVLANDMAVGEHDRRVSESIDKEVSLEHTEETLQDMVRDALVRIAEGNYGRCLKCSHVIPRVRLNALPFTPFCISCEREMEK